MAKYYTIDTVDPLPGEAAAIYGRQSLGKIKSIEEQIEECFDDAEEQGDPVVAIYQDEVSASRYGTSIREDWEQLLEDFKSGQFKKLYLWESSRGSRDAEEWLRLINRFRNLGFKMRISGSERTYDLQNPDDWEHLAKQGIDNERESQRISLRVARGLRKNAKKGKPHGKMTFGYKRIYEYDGATRKLVAQVPDNEARVTDTGYRWSPAGLVEYMFRSVRAGAKLGEIASELNAEKVPVPSLKAKQDGGTSKPTLETLKARIWRTTQIRYILLNEAYLGVRRHHRCPKPKPDGHNCEKERQTAKSGAWDSIVGADDFWKVNAELRDPSRVSGQVPGVKSTPKYFLSCIAKCQCGEDMLYLSPGKRRPRPYYRCRLSHCAVAVEEADAFVALYLWKWLNKPANLSLLRQTAAGQNKVAEEAVELLAVLENELAEWRDAIKFDPQNPKKARPSLAAFAEQESTLLEQIEAARVKARIRGVPSSVTDLASLSLSGMAEAWARSDFSIPKKRSVLKALVTVTVHSAGKGVRGNLEDRIKIEDLFQKENV